MALTLAFDIYGTIIDTSGIAAQLERIIGGQARAFTALWRTKQLEYSFRLGLMNRFEDFSVCTMRALEFCDQHFRADLTGEQKTALMAGYSVLPPFPDVEAGLETIRAKGQRMFAFSNGSAAAVSKLLENAGLRGYFEGVVSVEDVRMFKPSPIVYEHFCRCASTEKEQAWLVSGNPFDIGGAMAYGMKGIWVKRAPEAIFDSLLAEPTAIVSSLQDIDALLPA